MSPFRIVPALLLFVTAAYAAIDPAVIPSDIADAHQTAISALALTPDGSLAVTASRDSTLKIWNLADRTLVRTLVGHHGLAYGVAVTPDGQRIVSGGRDSTVRVWKIADGALERTIRLSARVWAVAAPAPPAGGEQLIVAAAGDSLIHVWRLADGEPVATLTGHEGQVKELVVAPPATDGSQVIVSSGTDGTVRAWGLPDGVLLWTSANWADASPLALVPSRGGIPIAVAANAHETGEFRFLALSDGSVMRTISRGTPGTGDIAFSPDGRWLVLRGGAISVWRVSDGTPFRSIAGYPSGPYTLVAFTAAGDRLVATVAKGGVLGSTRRL